MATKYFCDRCDGEYDQKQLGTALLDIRTYNDAMGYDRTKDDGPRAYEWIKDICPDCRTDLMETYARWTQRVGMAANTTNADHEQIPGGRDVDEPPTDKTGGAVAASRGGDGLDATNC